MKQLLLYRILTYILLPIAGILGLMAFLMLFLALQNFTLLLPLFILGSVVIYVATSFTFLQKAVLKNQLCKTSLRDWIRVNAFVSIVFCILFSLQSVSFLSQPELFRELANQTIKSQPGLPPGSDVLMFKTLKGMLYFFMIFSVLLFFHILTTFRVLKIYQHRFAEKG